MPLLTITGPDGSSRPVAWADGSIGIGREPSNHVQLEHPQVGRWHAAIFEEPGPSHRLRDLSSAGGTRVGGSRVRSHPLRDGDEIAIGPFRLTFCGRIDDTRPRSGHDLRITFGAGAGDPLGRRAVANPLTGTISWATAPARDSEADRPSPRALFEAVQAVASRLDVDELLECLLDQVGRFASPSVGFAALIDEDGLPDIRSRRARLSRAPGPEGVRVSQSLIDHALKTARPMDVHPALSPTVSQQLLGITRAVALPLVERGTVKGLIYADWRRGDEHSPGDHIIEWLAALAMYAGSAFENAMLFRRVHEHKERLEQSGRSRTQLVGLSPDARDVIDTIDRCAVHDFDILILGPTGTGKELIGRRLHERSRRRDGPYVAVNCASIPRELFESEMFGHARGAFTGAAAARLGRFQEAQGGTLFLDELGELSPDHQARLLRVLDERTVTPVGGRTVAVDIRIVAATNRDLEAAIATGAFRDDLYNRLGVPIRTTPLKDRPEDIPILAHYLLDRLTDEQGEGCREISPEVIRHLMQQPPPGNVRGLRRRLRNALVFAGDRITLSDLSHDPQMDRGGALPTLDAVEAGHIRRVLHATGGHQGRASEILGISPNTLKAKMDRYRIRRGDFQR